MVYLATKYALFAVVATVTNIATQYCSLVIYSSTFGLYLAMALGTLTGLFVKYVLDKKYIFYHTAKNMQDNFFKFIVYSFMGVFTTVVFWGTELLFHHLFSFEEAKFVGAVVGLTIGYVTKYHLDKKYVFINPQTI